MQTFTETPDAASGFPFFADDDKTSVSNVRKWTKPEYYKMAELGFFDSMKVELIEGEIIVNTDYEIVRRGDEVFMVMNTPHAVAIRLLVEVLRGIFGREYLVDSQLPLDFGGSSEPEPDLAVVEGSARDFVKAHPKSALLIVEVSGATLRFDRIRKSSLYAANGVKDYWIVNLKNRRLEVYRRPLKDENAFYGFSYAEVSVYTENETTAPLAAPEAEITVADLLP